MPAGNAQPHPLAGRLAPDLLLETRHGRTRVAELMRAARGVLLDLTDGSAVADSAVANSAVPDSAVPDFAGAEAAPGRAAPVTVITARCLAEPPPAAALLIRPDGIVAWAAGSGPRDPADSADPAAGMNEALRTWLSPRTPPRT